jgi:hypothetical protein
MSVEKIHTACLNARIDDMNLRILQLDNHIMKQTHMLDYIITQLTEIREHQSFPRSSYEISPVTSPNTFISKGMVRKSPEDFSLSQLIRQSSLSPIHFQRTRLPAITTPQTHKPHHNRRRRTISSSSSDSNSDIIIHTKQLSPRSHKATRTCGARAPI